MSNPASKYAELTGLSQRTVQNIFQTAGVPCERGKGYSENFALLALLKYFQAKLGDRGSATKDKLRDIEAQRAEIELGKAIGDLVNIEEGRAMFTALFVEAREWVRKRKDFSQKQKTETCDMLANLKMKPL